MKHNRKITIFVFALFITANIAIASLDIIPVAYATTTQTVLLTSPNTNATAASQTSATTQKPCTSGTCGLVVCDAVSSASGGSGQTICDFNAFLKEMRTVINWLFVIAIPVAIVLFAFGGVLYIIGTSKNRTWANQIFTATGIGFGIMLIAWVSVYTIVSWLTASGTGITSFLGK